MNPLSPSPAISQPLPPSALTVAAAAEVTTFQGVARRVGQQRVQRKGWHGVKYVRVGDFELNITSELVPQEYLAYRLKEGVEYRVTLEDLGSAFTSFNALPSDSRLSEGLSFVNKAQPVNVPDQEDARRLRKQVVGIWTDGISLSVDARRLPLKSNGLYRVRVQAVQAEQAETFLVSQGG